MGTSYVTSEEHTLRVNDGVLGTAVAALFEEVGRHTGPSGAHPSPALRSFLAEWRQQVEADATGVIGREIVGLTEHDPATLGAFCRSARRVSARGDLGRRLDLDAELHLIEHTTYGPRAYQVVAVLVALEMLVVRRWPLAGDEQAVNVGYPDDVSRRLASVIVEAE